MFAVFGALLLGLCFYDLVITVIAPRGSGPLTDLICRLVSPLERRLTTGSTGWLCLVAVATAWPFLLWLGWWFIFLLEPGSVVRSQTNEVTNSLEKLYFVGYCLSTLGLGDYIPTSDRWRIVTNLVSFSGLGSITLAITYILPVLSAATEKRQLADILHDLFPSQTSTDGPDRLFERLDNTVWPQLNLHTERHLAYPILHNFSTRKKENSLALGLLKMHESLRSLSPNAPVRNLLSALDRFLATIEADFVSLDAVEAQGASEEAREKKLQAFYEEWN